MKFFSHAFYRREYVSVVIWDQRISNWHAMHPNNNDLYAMQEFNSICSAVPPRSILSCILSKDRVSLSADASSIALRNEREEWIVRDEANELGKRVKKKHGRMFRNEGSRY